MKRNLCEQAGLFTSFAQLSICICICISFVFVFVKKNSCRKRPYASRIISFFCSIGLREAPFLSKKKIGLDKEKKRTRTKKVFCRPKTYASRIISSCARLHARSGSVRKILSIKRTKKSDKKTRKPLAEGEYASK